VITVFSPTKYPNTWIRVLSSCFFSFFFPPSLFFLPFVTTVLLTFSSLAHLTPQYSLQVFRTHTYLYIYTHTFKICGPSNIQVSIFLAHTRNYESLTEALSFGNLNQGSSNKLPEISIWSQLPRVQRVRSSVPLLLQCESAAS